MMSKKSKTIQGGAGNNVSGRAHGRAICLSGGGYRAALFHLGVLRAMNDAGLLSAVVSVSSVSGGSILSAFLVRKKLEYPDTVGLEFDNWETSIAEPFRKLTATDIRTGPILLSLPWNWAFPGHRAARITKNLRNIVGRRAATGEVIKLSDLPASPNFIFNASDLTFGANWEFERGAVGSYQSKKGSSDAFDLGFAVAASACFPPVFGPITIDFSDRVTARDDEHKKLLSRLMLSDGGVYDNLGIEPVLKTHREIFISDGGSPFRPSSSRFPTSRYTRFIFVVMNQVAALRKRQFFTDLYDGRFDGSLFGIDDQVGFGDPVTVGGYDAELTRLIAGIRTDLDSFSDAEARILENHGYFVCRRKLREKHAGKLSVGADLNKIPNFDWTEKTAVKNALRRSHRRFSPMRLLHRG